MLTGCGGDSQDDTAAPDANTTAGAPQEPSVDDDAADAGDLPEDFPTDVPLPGYKAVHKVGSSTEGFQYWSVVFELDYATETPVADYAAILEDAGYTIDDASANNVDAEGQQWDVSFHSALEGTLTVSVMER